MGPCFLIGSMAMEFWGISVATKSSDWDIVCSKEDFKVFKGSPLRIEHHDIDDLMNREICERFSSDINTMYVSGVRARVVDQYGLACIKRSHLHRTVGWNKHITHYTKHLKQFMTPQVYELAMKRKKLTIEKYADRRPRLNQSNEDFFDDAVIKKYDHDMLHEMVAFFDRPIYTYLKYEDKTDLAWCEKDLWNNLTHNNKVRCVAEEAYVIGAERFLIPRNWNYPAKLAYFTAVEKVCTTLTSGWFRDFAIDHFEEIIDLYDSLKYESLKKQLEQYDERNLANV